jgi:hypothetical protein
MVWHSVQWLNFKREHRPDRDHGDRNK